MTTKQMEGKVVKSNAPINCFRDGGEGRRKAPRELIFSEKFSQVPVPWVNIAGQISCPRD